MSQSAYVSEATLETFGEVVMEASFRQPVLVDFWADWCEPCKQLTPVLEKLTEEFRGGFQLVKVNCEEQQELAAQIGVRSLPTVLLVKDGQPADQFQGVLPESQVRQFLEQHVKAPEASPQEQIQAFLEQGDFGAALPLLVDEHRAKPDDSDIAIDLARALFHSGDVEQAESVLERLPDAARHDDRVKGMQAQRAFAERVQALPDVAELQARLQRDAGDAEARYQLALHLVVQGAYQEAMDHLLQLVRTASDWNDGQARQTLLEVFNLLGPEHPLARPYRQKLFQLMY
ncbi:thioredoxin [Methylonatrum kenyense]|uniref:thioredoxin n=1 Tax=Methylonatrum kenyense TaxID=455253 RepID=UPI0020BDBB00|nr:thioredoxin [Methylonatrum kenyense]MCK8515660.1 thioredoxin [Methylonatrum kenyense]